MRLALLAGLGCVLLLAAPARLRAQAAQDLVTAAGRGDVAAVREQLARGAPVEARDARTWTALMVASARGHTEVVRALLAAGADPNSRADDGSTPLMAAAVGGHIGAARALLDAGADPSLRNRTGATARSKATEYGRTEIASLLEVRGDSGAAPTASPGAAPPEPTAFDVEEIEEVRILAREATFHKEPTFAAPIVGQLPKGVQLRITGRVVGRPWYRVGPAARAVYVESEATLPSAAP